VLDPFETPEYWDQMVVEDSMSLSPSLADDPTEIGKRSAGNRKNSLVSRLPS
jgi:hypothetical protein